MSWKGIDIFRHDTAFPFMKWKEWAIGLSVALGLISLALMYKPGLNYSIDFKGGTLIEVQSKSGPANLAAIRETFEEAGLLLARSQGGGPLLDARAAHKIVTADRQSRIGGMENRKVLRSMELMSGRVMPRVRKETALAA